ncbi:hypothetical protein [Aliiroseovarius sp. PrR006]|uniref:hypothetical protein n=1 Tax=Aliiroseovarius sp. PrR006 TaxID=2706883 RepID=UPI0013D87A41|nr:hypothetical protein [Aliiroseovarius sp. PrR006]NDW53214.1 hypothetical protein [Aliiroseovarius sp. PrR006]
MTSWTSLMVAMCFTALPAQARDIAVRSGEHDGFTRLVFYTQSNDTVDISHANDGYLLTLTSGGIDFDILRAFDLIDRSRVGDLVFAGDGKLVIRQACDCHLKNVRLPSGELVIDIIDGPDPTRHSDASPKPPPTQPIVDVAQRRASLPLFNPPAEPTESVEEQEEVVDKSAVETADLIDETPKVDRQALLAQLSRAASQGLIDANIDPPDISPKVVPAEAEAKTPEPPPITHVPEEHVRMQTAVEQARTDGARSDGRTSASHACLPDEQFDIARWGDYASGNNAPVVETSSYLGEFDRPDKDRLVAHIRQNIYMTFGLEALQLLDSYDANLGDGAVLRMMAEVVEYGEAKSHAVWAPQLVCNTRGALWATLAQPALQGRVDTNAVLRSFSELPPHLRTHLGPALARKFLNSGRIETAIEIRNIAARSGRPPTGDEAILDAKINFAVGQKEQAEQELTDTIQSTLTQTQPAISALIESKLHSGTGISDNELSLLTSVAFEHQRSKEGDALHRLQIRALLHMGRFAPAFELIDGLADPGSLLEDAGRYLVALGSDAEFLTYSLTRSDWGRVSAAVRLEMAKRQSALGFHEHARRHVLSGDDTPTRSEREFLAELALLQSKPKVALGYLAGLSSSDANLLREKANEMSTIPIAEASPGQATGSSSDILRKLDTAEHPIPEPVQMVLASATPASAVSIETDLTTYQGILDGSSETRAALSELLNIIPTINDSK